MTNIFVSAELKEAFKALALAEGANYHFFFFV